MFGFICGTIFGITSFWFVTRFKDALILFKKNTENKIEETLKK